ncbi:hypothetical protein [Phytoactinopolyspora endophytica]|uniref:hypothetical protein n=1 Tax=Phytoactinopolyspora endophytica TaxID=1642495 RepID=UPI00101C98B9|nr:hypothetical protein [Phytoactinopolyspora endophytica]
MNIVTIGLFTGLLLGVAAATGGLDGFLITLALGAAGALIAGQFSGALDLRAAFRARERD